MPAPIYSASDYARAMSNLLPRGYAWPREPDTALMALMRALAPTYERNNAAAAALIVDIFPATTSTLLPEWEATLGLPDACTPPNPSTEQRVRAVVVKFIGGGGQSAAYFISVAAALGIEVTVTNFGVARADYSVAGDPDNSEAWAHTWAINAPLTTVQYALAGLASAGDPLATWGNAELECRLNAIKPAQGILLFFYS